MLINADLEICRSCAEPILSLIALAQGKQSGARKIRDGIYEVSHFGSSDFMRGWEEYADLGQHNSYGVCDGADNLLEAMPILQDPVRQFVVTLTKVERDLTNKGQGGGWRWHKWGPYIGKHEPKMEYLDDEPDIDHVYCYHVYEKTAATA